MENNIEKIEVGRVKGGFKLLTESWGVYKDNWKKFVLIVLIGFVGVLVGALIIGGFVILTNTMLVGSKAALLSIIFSALGMCVIFASYIFSWVVLLVQVKNPGDDLKLSMRKALSLFWVMLLLLIINALVVIFGYIFLIVPGIILAMYLTFSPFILVNDGKGLLASFSESFSLVHGFWFTIFARMLVFGVFSFIVYIPQVVANLLNATIYGVGGGGTVGGTILSLLTTVYGLVVSFLVTPLFTIFGYKLYLEVLQKKSGNAEAKDGMKVWKKILLALLPAFFVAGFLFAIVMAAFTVSKNIGDVSGLPSSYDSQLDDGLTNIGGTGDVLADYPKKVEELPEEQRKQLELYAKQVNLTPQALLDQLNVEIAKQLIEEQSAGAASE